MKIVGTTAGPYSECDLALRSTALFTKFNQPNTAITTLIDSAIREPYLE